MQTIYLSEPLASLTSHINCNYIPRYDLREFGNAVFETWRKLDAQARSADAFCFPAWTRFEIFDREGNCIFSSEPVLLGTDDADINSVNVSVTYGSTRFHILPAPLTRRAWKPEVTTSDIPVQFRNKAASVKIYVRSTVDFPEWSISATDLVSCLTHYRVIMSPRPEADEHLYKSFNLPSPKNNTAVPRRHLLSQRPRRKPRQRKMMRSAISPVTVCLSINYHKVSTRYYSPALSHERHLFTSTLRFGDPYPVPSREPPHFDVPIISDG